MGGSAEIVEKLVEILRHHYKYVNFIISDCAMSAGTLFALSGDKLYMDYSSSLGPVDPQVHNRTEWVPALGYLDQVEKMIQKSNEGKFTDVDVLIIRTGKELDDYPSQRMACPIQVSQLDGASFRPGKERKNRHR